MKSQKRPFSSATLGVVVAFVVAAGCGDDDDDTGADENPVTGADAGVPDAASMDAASDATDADAGSQPDGGQGGAGGTGGDEAGGTGGSGGGGEEGEDAGVEPEPDAAADSLEIVGTYLDNWGTRHEITDESWTQIVDADTSVFVFSQFSNDDNYAIAQNHPDNQFNPGLWSRLEWTEHDGSLWYCQSVYDAETEQDALEADAADASDPANGGCVDFSWSEMTPE